METNTNHFDTLDERQQAHVMSIVDGTTARYMLLIKNKSIFPEVTDLCKEVEVELDKLKEAYAGILKFPNDYYNPRHLVYTNIDTLLNKIKILLYLYLTTQLFGNNSLYLVAPLHPIITQK